MSEESIHIVRQGYEAHSRGEIAATFALLHPEIEITQTTRLPWSGVYHGHAEAGLFFRRLNEHIESRVEPQEYVVAGDNIAVTGRIRGHVRGNGQTFDLRIVHIWTIQADKAIRFEAYIDTPEMLRALEG